MDGDVGVETILCGRQHGVVHADVVVQAIAKPAVLPSQEPLVAVEHKNKCKNYFYYPKG